MPRITRERASLLDSSMVRFVGIVLGVAGLASLGALFLGFSDKGMIDVNTKIASTDQSSFSTKVNAARPTDMPNGGLVPSEGEPVPAPVAEPAPEIEGASTTSATSTEEETSTDSASAEVVTEQSE